MFTHTWLRTPSARGDASPTAPPVPWCRCPGLRPVGRPRPRRRARCPWDGKLPLARPVRGYGADVFLVRGDPVAGHLLLRRVQVHLPSAHQRQQLVLKLVLRVGVPRLGQVALRPQVLFRVAAAEREGNKVVDLVLAGDPVLDAVGGVHLAFHRHRHVAHLGAVALLLDVGQRHVESVARRELWIGQDRRATGRLLTADRECCHEKQRRDEGGQARGEKCHAGEYSVEPSGEVVCARQS